ncbi:MAG: hypothetical protein ACYC6N_06360 [Pirellulaceae bacterium]
MAGLRRGGYLRVTLGCVLWILASAAVVPDARGGVTCRLGASDGARRYRAGAWGIVEVFAVNSTNEPAEAQSVAWFVDDPTLQYSRRVTVPANATLRTTCPLRIPELPSRNARYVEFLTEQVIPAPRADREQRSPQDAMLAAQPLLLDPETPAVGILGDFEGVFPPPGAAPYHTAQPDFPHAPDEIIYELVVAAKRARKLSRRISTFDMKDLPPDPAVLDVLDVLVLSTDRLASDAGGIAIVRDWVLGGGRLWILLDEVHPDTVTAVLGDAFATAVLDRVKLTDLKISNARFESPQQSITEVEVEQPIDLVRVVPAGVTITETVNGWPAAFWQPMGAGRVYFTTLSTAAWIHPTTGRDAPPLSQQDVSFYSPEDRLVDFAQECFVKRPDSEIAAQVLHPFLTQQIGYRILSGSVVTLLLAIFCGTLAVAGVWFFRAGHPERLLWIIPLVVVVVSLAFVAIATVTKRAVPPTLAMIARVALEPGVGTGHSFGMAAMYNQDASDERLGAARGGIFVPDMTAMSGRRRRVVWTDEGAWHWENLELPAGVRTAPFCRPVPLDATVDCRARFGPQGLEGRLGPLSFSELQDAVIAMPHQPMIGATFDGQGAFRAGAQDVLAPGDFSVQTWIGDLQRRRKAIYQAIFAAPPESDAPAVPVLFAWSDTTDTGFIFPQTRQLNSTLLSIPIRLERSSPGTQVIVPATFLPYRAIVDPDGHPPSAYANLMHRWVENKLAVSDWVRFQLPREVLPIQLDRATLRVTIRAASRSLQVLAISAGEPVEVLHRSRPIGSYSVVLDRPEHLQLDDKGGLLLIIRVGQDETATPLDPMSEASWLIESLQLEVAGTVQADGSVQSE